MSDMWHAFCLTFLAALILAACGASRCGFDGKGLRVNIDGTTHHILVNWRD